MADRIAGKSRELGKSLSKFLDGSGKTDETYAFIQEGIQSM
jgi:hypothetical protein